MHITNGPSSILFSTLVTETTGCLSKIFSAQELVVRRRKGEKGGKARENKGEGIGKQNVL